MGVFGLLGVISAFLVRSILFPSSAAAGLLISSEPTAVVFVNSKEVGHTPFDQKFPPGEVSIKLVPQNSTLPPFETKLRLVQGAYSVIRRTFAASEDYVANEIVSLVSQPGKSSGLSVITTDPDSVSISIDGQPQGFTPLSLNPITPTDHEISLTAAGYEPKTIKIRPQVGYLLQISAKLAVSSISAVPTPPSSASASASPSLTEAKSVTILSTPTGFLRVREQPGRNYAEVGRVSPGDKLNLLSTKEDWYEIKLPASSSTSSGWISSEYAKINN